MRRIFETFKDELHEPLEKLKELFVTSQKIRITANLYSRKLSQLEREYSTVLPELFEVIRKLDTPDLLFKDLDVNDGERLGAYFSAKPAIQSATAEVMKYTEVIDKAIDRKNQTIHNNRTLIASVVALFLSVVTLFGWADFPVETHKNSLQNAMTATTSATTEIN